MRVAATGAWTDEDGTRHPAGEVHGWSPGRNSTACGLQLSRSGLTRFADVEWEQAQPESGGRADAVAAVCRRCSAASGRRRDERRWSRQAPRP